MWLEKMYGLKKELKKKEEVYFGILSRPGNESETKSKHIDMIQKKKKKTLGNMWYI